MIRWQGFVPHLYKYGYRYVRSIYIILICVGEIVYLKLPSLDLRFPKVN